MRSALLFRLLAKILGTAYHNLLPKLDHIIWRTGENVTYFFKRKHSDVFVLFQCVKGFVVYASFQQLILRYLTLLHCVPQRAIINNGNHPVHESEMLRL